MVSRILQSIFRVIPFPVLVVFFLAAIIRFIKLGEFDNSYYSATVLSMLESPKNFFFGSFDPGGYVTVDKPPFAFWTQAFFVLIFGFNAWSLGLPQLLSGLCILVFVYKIVTPTFGKIVGISAMTVLAFLPVVLVIDTRNEPDGILSLLLITATYSLIRGVKTNSYIWLIICSIFIGLAFNTKMLVAFIPVPAFFLYLFLASQEHLMKTIKKAFLIIVVGGIVSFSWPLAVSVTPEHSRPYIGSTNDNSVWTLIFEYNGLKRFGGFTGPPSRNSVNFNNSVQPRGMQVNAQQNLPQQMVNTSNIQGDRKHPIILLSNNLASQLGWFFPVSLLGFILLIRRTVKRLKPKGKLIDVFKIKGDNVFAEGWLWGMWYLIATIVFSSAASTFTHPYYLVGLAIPFSVLIGITVKFLISLFRSKATLGWLVFLFIAGTCFYQIYNANNVGLINISIWSNVSLAICFISMIFLLIYKSKRMENAPIAVFMLIIAMGSLLLVPLKTGMDAGPRIVNIQMIKNPQQTLMKEKPFQIQRFLKEDKPFQSNAFIATVNAKDAASFIMQEQLALSIGGFSGRDEIFSLQKFQDLARKKEINYFYFDVQGPIPIDYNNRIRNDNQLNKSPFSNLQIIEWVKSNWEDISFKVGLPPGSFYRYFS